MAETLLSNPVIEDFEVHVEDHFVSEAPTPVETRP